MMRPSKLHATENEAVYQGIHVGNHWAEPTTNKPAALPVDCVLTIHSM
jgi:hypothetical protein